MNNDDAREAARVAALDAYQEEVPMQDESDAESHERGWNDAIAHLRTTGQLCTAEERAILESVALECEPRTMTNYDRSEAFRRIYGVARRAKGGSDVG